jgi:DNA polymerase V
VGIRPTKTLVKLANHCAKKRTAFNSVCNFYQMPVDNINQILNEIDVGEVCGVGRKLVPKL